MAGAGGLFIRSYGGHWGPYPFVQAPAEVEPAQGLGEAEIWSRLPTLGSGMSWIRAFLAGCWAFFPFWSFFVMGLILAMDFNHVWLVP